MNEPESPDHMFVANSNLHRIAREISRFLAHNRLAFKVIIIDNLGPMLSVNPMPTVLNFLKSLNNEVSKSGLAGIASINKIMINDNVYEKFLNVFDKEITEDTI